MQPQLTPIVREIVREIAREIAGDMLPLYIFIITLIPLYCFGSTFDLKLPNSVIDIWFERTRRLLLSVTPTAVFENIRMLDY